MQKHAAPQLIWGIIGAYPGRTFNEVKQRLLYVLKDREPPVQREIGTDNRGINSLIY